MRLQNIKEEKKHILVKERTLINRILVPLDGSEYANKALDYAIQLAKKFSSEILLVHVLPATTAIRRGSEVISTSLYRNLRKRLEEDAHRILTSSEAKVRDAGIKVTMKLDYGDPAGRIINIAKKDDMDLIVIADKGLGAVAKFFLGSISNKISHHATCHVLIFKSQYRSPLIEI